MSKSADLEEVVAWPSVGEMCRQLQISLNRGYVLLWSGRISAQKIGGQWRISPVGIARYAEERKAHRHA